MENIKIVFIDIDGTLVNNEKKITIFTSKSIKRIKDKGIIVILVSGRNCPHVINKSKQSTCSSLVIASGGAIIYDYNNEKIIFEDIINYNKVTDVWNYCMENKIGLMLNSSKKVYCNKYFMEQETSNYELIEDINECKKNNIVQFLIMSDKIEKIDNICKYLKTKKLSVTNSSFSYSERKKSSKYYIDVNSDNITKGIAITKLLNYLELKKENSMCFGNSYNDFEMFSSCKIKVAMGNAVKELKEKADYITGTNNEDGVATFLNKYL